MRLMRLLTASVGPFDTRERCQATILVIPAGDGSAELVDLRGAGLVLDAGGEPAGVFVGEAGVSDLVDIAEGFFGVPGQPDLSVGVPGRQEALEAFPAGGVEAFLGQGQQLADPIQGVVFAAPVAYGFVLDSAADLVEAVVGQPDHMERIRDLRRVGDGRVVGGPVRAREDPAPPSGSVPAMSAVVR